MQGFVFWAFPSLRFRFDGPVLSAAEVLSAPAQGAVGLSAVFPNKFGRCRCYP